MRYDDNTSNLTLNFSELHDILSGLSNMGPEDNGQKATVATITLEPMEPNEDGPIEGDTPNARSEWERKFNELLEHIIRLDNELHDHFDGCI